LGDPARLPRSRSLLHFSLPGVRPEYTAATISSTEDHFAPHRPKKSSRRRIYRFHRCEAARAGLRINRPRQWPCRRGVPKTRLQESPVHKMSSSQKAFHVVPLSGLRSGKNVALKQQGSSVNGGKYQRTLAGGIHRRSRARHFRVSRIRPLATSASNSTGSSSNFCGISTCRYQKLSPTHELPDRTTAMLLDLPCSSSPRSRALQHEFLCGEPVRLQRNRVVRISSV